MKHKTKSERAEKKQRDYDARLAAEIARQQESGPDAPTKINNFLVNKPQMSVPNNCWLDKLCQTRSVQENTPVVNGQVADNSLIHKPVFEDENQKFFPIIDPNVLKKTKGLKNKES